jgi:hypothetical protein
MMSSCEMASAACEPRLDGEDNPDRIDIRDDATASWGETHETPV